MGKNLMIPGGLRLLLRALMTWAVSALLLLLAVSLILSRGKAGSALLGYCSSAISFLSAASAAYFASDRKLDRPLLRSLLLVFQRLCSEGRPSPSPAVGLHQPPTL